jgi:predicted transcriptional regulator
MSNDASLVKELSLTEKRVLLALDRLKGGGTPEQVQRAMLPDAVARLSDALERTLASAFEDTGMSVGESQKAGLMERFLDQCPSENPRQMDGCVVSTLVAELSRQILSLEVPIQRNVIAKLLGECAPAVSSALGEVIVKGRVETGFVSGVEVMNSCSWLRAKGLVTMEESLERHYSLVSKRGGSTELPERRALKLLKKAKGTLSVEELGKDKSMRSEEVPIALGWLKRKGWARIEKRGGETVLELTEDGKRFLSKKGLDEELLESLAEGEKHESELDPDTVEKLLKRQDMIKVRESVFRTIVLTDEGQRVARSGLEMAEEVSQLTPELLQGGGWRGKSIRRYSVDTFAPDLVGGKSHPLQQYIDKVRGIFLNMGFEEIDY